MLAGDKYRQLPDGGRGIDALHFYDQHGIYVSSFFTLPASLEQNNLTVDDRPLLAPDYGGSELVAIPSINKLNIMQSNGQLSLVLPVQFREFRPAPPAPHFERDTMHIFFSWQLQWTPLVAVGSTKSLYMVQYQTFNPLRYTLHVWPKNNPAESIDYHTNSLLLASRGDGELWFLKNTDNTGVQSYEVFKGYAK